MDLLDRLASLEAQHRIIIDGVGGTMEDKSASLDALGIYDAYSAIHQDYTHLLKDDPTQEALKRALFIQWYSLLEPGCFSGINEIDAQAERLVLTELNRLLSTNRIDAELRCMLLYYSKWEWVFQRDEFKHLQALQGFVEANKSVDNALTAPPIQITTMGGRGQMGHYFLTWGGGKLLRPTSQ